MTNGFISSRENLEVEDVGSMIWNELCQKSFFQDIQTSDYSNIIFFKMHDLVHDLAQSIVGQECVCLENVNMAKLSKSTHHVTFPDVHIKSLDSLDEGAFKKIESLRTLIQTEYHGKKTPYYFPTNRSLRVLCTAFFPLSSLGTLIHLRCLELYAFDIKTFPNSIYNLKKLEILKLAHCNKLSCLPKNMSCLQNLRHIVIEHFVFMTRMFPYIGKLSKLRKLSLYIVRSERGHSLAELHDLNLGGKLEILSLNNVGSLFEAQEENLIGKKDLNELCLSWTSKGMFTGRTPTLSAEQLLKVLQPQTNLKRLTINYYKGLCFPSWITILSSLVTLELRGCPCVSVLPLGKLPSLKSLKLFDMDSVKYMDDDGSPNAMEVTVFSSLRVLLLAGLPNLERIFKVERRNMFPCLSTLTIEYCPKLELPCLPSVKTLHVYACNNEVLKSISSFYGLTALHLSRIEGITSFPDGMLKNLSWLQTLKVDHFPKLKELPNESFNLALERLEISYCDELESLPEQIWEGMQSLQTMSIHYCKGLRCLPEGIRHLTSLEVLIIDKCPTLKERCMEGTGEDWDKIRHIPKLIIH
jgi:Leucine-rich repeat (LRR) protein